MSVLSNSPQTHSIHNEKKIKAHTILVSLKLLPAVTKGIITDY